MEKVSFTIFTFISSYEAKRAGKSSGKVIKAVRQYIAGQRLAAQMLHVAKRRSAGQSHLYNIDDR